MALEIISGEVEESAPWIDGKMMYRINDAWFSSDQVNPFDVDKFRVKWAKEVQDEGIRLRDKMRTDWDFTHLSDTIIDIEPDEKPSEWLGIDADRKSQWSMMNGVIPKPTAAQKAELGQLRGFGARVAQKVEEDAAREFLARQIIWNPRPVYHAKKPKSFWQRVIHALGRL